MPTMQHYLTWKIDSDLRLIGGGYASAHISTLFPELPEPSPLWDAIQEALGGIASVRSFSWRHTTWRVSAWPDPSGQTVRGNCAPLLRSPIEPRIQHEILVQQAALTRHISHDMNGLLGSVLNYAEHQLASGIAPHEELQRIRAAAQEMASRISDLRSLTISPSRRRMPLPIYAWLQQWLSNHSPALAQHTIQLELSPPDPGLVPVQEALLQAALDALLQNARAATPAGGTIRIQTRLIAAGAPELRGWPQIAQGEHLLLSVTDTGPGMNAETLAHATEPFYSKEGARRGLGLSRALGCAHLHGGAFCIESALGTGTTVNLTLPRRAEQGAAEGLTLTADRTPLPAIAANLTTAPPDPWHAAASPPEEVRAHILLADDTDAVRSATRRVLERSSHRVTEATDGHSAFQIFQRSPEAFDIAVLDADMPGNGLELAARIRALRPTMPILIITGHHLSRVPWPMIQKPYHPTLLLSSVQQLLR